MPALADFAGRWRLERRILDRLAGVEGRFEGEATLTPAPALPGAPATLLYAERGLLTLGTAPPMTAERRYLWAQGPDGRIAVRFDDGRPFHGFDPGAGTVEAAHRCDPDDYRVAYDFAAWPDWQSTWNVTGPRKNYRMESRYRR